MNCTAIITGPYGGTATGWLDIAPFQGSFCGLLRSRCRKRVNRAQDGSDSRTDQDPWRGGGLQCPLSLKLSLVLVSCVPQIAIVACDHGATDRLF